MPSFARRRALSATYTRHVKPTASSVTGMIMHRKESQDGGHDAPQKLKAMSTACVMETKSSLSSIDAQTAVTSIQHDITTENGSGLQPYAAVFKNALMSPSVMPDSPSNRVLGTDELLSMIIQFTDTTTAKSCAICCRRWYSIAQRVVWRRLRLVVQSPSSRSRTRASSNTGHNASEHGRYIESGQKTNGNEFLQRIITKFERTSYIGLDHVATIASIAQRFVSVYPNTLCYVRHIDLDLVVPLDRSEAGKEVSHFLGQVFAAGNIIAACPRLRMLNVRLTYGRVKSNGPENGQLLAQDGQDAGDGMALAAEAPMADVASLQQDQAARPRDSVGSIDSMILDESDEEVLSINISRVLIPAVRILEVMLRKGCRSTPSLWMQWSMDMPDSRPTRLIPFASGGFRSEEGACSTQGSSHNEVRMVSLSITDASGTHPRKLADLMHRLDEACVVFELHRASMTTSVIAVLDRRAQTGSGVKQLHLPMLRALDEDAFFNGFLGRSARDLECLDLSGLVLMFRVEMRAQRLACCGLKRLCLNGVRDHLHDDFFKALSVSCPELEDLECRDNAQVSDAALVAVVKRCPRLRRLDAGGCVKLTTGVISGIAASSALCLRTLGIGWLPNVVLERQKPESLAASAICEAAERCPRLWALQVSVAGCRDESVHANAPAWWPQRWPQRSKAVMWLCVGSAP